MADTELHRALRGLAEGGAPPQPPPERLQRRAALISRRRKMRGVMAAFVIVAAVGSSAPWWWPWGGTPSKTLHAVGPPPTGPCAGQAPGCGQGPDTAADLAAGKWAPMAPAPFPGRSGMSSVWTGQSLLAWGGATFSGSGASYRETPYADGATYTPTSNSWSAMGPSGLPPV